MDGGSALAKLGVHRRELSLVEDAFGVQLERLVELLVERVELLPEAVDVLADGAPTLGQGSTLNPGHEVGDAFLFQELLLEEADGERLNRFSRDVVVGAGGLSPLRATQAPVDIPAAGPRSHVMLTAEPTDEDGGEKVGVAPAIADTELPQARPDLFSDLRSDQRRVRVFVDRPLVRRAALLPPDEAPLLAADHAALAEALIRAPVDEVAEIDERVLFEAARRRGRPPWVPVGRRDAPPLKVPKDGPAALSAGPPPEVLLDHWRGGRVRFVDTLRNRLAVAVLANGDHPPPVPIGRLATGPIAPPHVLTLAFHALLLRHAGVQFVPYFHHLLEDVVHVRAGLGELQEAQLDAALLAQVVLERLRLKGVPGDAGRVEDIDFGEGRRVLLGGGQERPETWEIIPR